MTDAEKDEQGTMIYFLILICCGMAVGLAMVLSVFLKDHPACRPEDEDEHSL